MSNHPEDYLPTTAPTFSIQSNFGAATTSSVPLTDAPPHHSRLIGSGGHYQTSINMSGYNKPHEAEPVPDRFELFLLSDDEKKVTWQFDTRTSLFPASFLFHPSTKLKYNRIQS